MTEEPLSEFDPPPCPPERPQTPAEPKPKPPYYVPPFWLMFFLGILLPIASGFLCVGVRAPWPFVMGALWAFMSLFFRGWRGIFVGYLAAIALAVLTVIMICGSSHPSL